MVNQVQAPHHPTKELQVNLAQANSVLQALVHLLPHTPESIEND